MIGALAHRDFRLMWIGLVISNVGTWMRMYGMGWLVVQLAVQDGSPHLGGFYLGLVGLGRAVPGLAFGLFAGVVADRVDRRKLLVATEAVAGLLAAALAFLTITDQISVAAVIIISALMSLTFSFDMPARSAMLPRLVPEPDLLSAIGLMSTAFNISTLIGPLLGGVLIVPFGIGGLFVISALSYFAIVGALLLIHDQPVIPGRRQNPLAAIAEGVSFVRAEAILGPALILMAGMAVFGRPYIQLLPAIAQDSLHAGAVELSWLLAASGVGALAGSMSIGWFGAIHRRGLLVALSSAVCGALVVLFALQETLPAALLTIAIVSSVTMVSQGIIQSLFQTRSPNELRGRVMSLTSMSFQVGMPSGQMVLGSLGALIGIGNAVALGGVAFVALALFVTLRATDLRALGNEDADAALGKPAVELGA